VAQWLGQFSGHTHATRVEDAEAALRHAVAVFRAAGSPKAKESKARAVRNLAMRLLSARLRLLKARIAAAEPLAAERAEQSSGIESLQQREANLRAEGLQGILAEFGAEDAIG